jgi:hypothetical protein
MPEQFAVMLQYFFTLYFRIYHNYCRDRSYKPGLPPACFAVISTNQNYSRVGNKHIYSPILWTFTETCPGKGRCQAGGRAAGFKNMDNF